jgi:hypothetical protein
VDGFNQDKGASKADNGGIAFRGFFAAHRDTFEAFQLAHGLFNPGASFVEQLRKEFRAVFGI